MEDEISEWVELEYSNIIKNVGKENFILSGLNPKLKNKFDIKTYEQSVEHWDIDNSKVLLLDPKATRELTAEDAKHYEYLLFGGILGDDPPQDRTGILRNMGFETRHLGPKQMTTDTGFVF